jgi:hypothetical protein
VNKPTLLFQRNIAYLIELVRRADRIIATIGKPGHSYFCTPPLAGKQTEEERSNRQRVAFSIAANLSVWWSVLSAANSFFGCCSPLKNYLSPKFSGEVLFV